MPLNFVLGPVACSAKERPLLSAQRVLEATDGVLHLAFYLVGLALGFGLLVAGGFARPFLDFALGLLGRALDAILVDHVKPLRCELRWATVEAARGFPAIDPHAYSLQAQLYGAGRSRWARSLLDAPVWFLSRITWASMTEAERGLRSARNPALAGAVVAGNGDRPCRCGRC